MEKGKLQHFDFVEINGMKLSEPRQAYVQILKQLSGKVLTWGQAHNTLEKRFNSKAKKPMTLLLVDEVCVCVCVREICILVSHYFVFFLLLIFGFYFITYYSLCYLQLLMIVCFCILLFYNFYYFIWTL